MRRDPCKTRHSFACVVRALATQSVDILQAAAAKLQTLLEVDQLDDTAHERAPLLSMLTGVGSAAHLDQVVARKIDIVQVEQWTAA